MPSSGRYGTQVRTSVFVMSLPLGWLVHLGHGGEQAMSNPVANFLALVCKGRRRGRQASEIQEALPGTGPPS